MKCEVPKFQRCCLCIPLRYGLIIWAYVKLIPTLVLLLLYSSTFSNGRNYRASDTFLRSLPIVAMLIDVIFNILLLIACHKKHVKLFRIYYYYSIVMLALFGLLMLFNFGYLAYQFANCISGKYCYVGEVMIFIILLGLISVNILNFLLQFYLIMLVKSELIKLKANATFTFVNVKTVENSIGNTETSEKFTEEKVKYNRFDNEV